MTQNGFASIVEKLSAILQQSSAGAVDTNCPFQSLSLPQPQNPHRRHNRATSEYALIADLIRSRLRLISARCVEKNCQSKPKDFTVQGTYHEVIS